MAILFSFIFSFPALAAPTRTTYQAKIIKPDGNPLEASSVNFRFSILDPAGTCILFIEDFSSVNMINSGGLIALPLGSGTKTFPTSGPITFSEVFDNSTANLPCQSGVSFTPTVTDIRKIVMQFHDGNGWQTIPAMAINSVPYANYANKSLNSMKLNGKADTAFVEKANLPICVNGEALKFDGTTFTCVSAAGGSSGTVTNVSSSNSYLSIVSGTTAPMITLNVGTLANTVAAGNDSRIVGALQAASNLSDVASSATARTNLGLGSVLSDIATVSGVANSALTTSNSKITSSAASLAEVLGYVPAASGATAVDVTALKISNNLSDVTSASAARTNLGLGSVLSDLANKITSSTASIIEVLGYTPANSATVSTLDARVTTVSNAVTTLQSDLSGVSVTANSKITSSAASVAQVLGYVPSASGSVVSSQWNTSGNTINYMAGNVGIGNNNPTSTLDVKSTTADVTISANSTVNSQFSQFVAGANDGTAPTFHQIAFGSTAAGTTFGLSRNGLTALYVDGSAATALGIGTVTNIPVVIGTGGAERVRVTSAGSVGVGTATPGFTLDVRGSGVSSRGSYNLRRTLDDASIASISWSNADNGLLYGNNNGGYHSWNVNGSEKMRMDSAGNFGIGTANPATKLEVSGGVRISMESAVCAAGLAGTLRYNGGNVEYCNGTSWSAFGVAGAGVTSVNGSTSGSQSFSFGSFGATPGVSTANGVHTFNFPLASTTGVVGGLLSFADYTTFANKVTSSSASISQALGYVPVASGSIVSSQWITSGTDIYRTTGNVAIGDPAMTSGNPFLYLYGYNSATSAAAYGRLRVDTAGNFNITAQGSYLILDSANYIQVQKSVNMTTGQFLYNGVPILGYASGVTSLGAGSAVSQVVLGSNSTSSTVIYGNVGIGTTSPATKLDVSGGVRISMESGSCSAALAGTLRYNGGNVEYCNGTSWSAFGIVGSGITSSAAAIQQVLGYVPAASGSIVSSQWTTSGSTINYMSGSVGLGVDVPTEILDVAGNIKSTGNLNLAATTSNTVGVIKKGSSSFIHDFIASGTHGRNTFVGLNSGNFTMAYSSAATDASYNTGNGYNSLSSLTRGNYNSAFGVSALASATSGSNNSGFGVNALAANTTGSNNVAMGMDALSQSISSNNTAAGYSALKYATGGQNAAFGYNAAVNTAAGTGNTALGSNALQNSVGKSESTAIGYYAMSNADSTATNSTTYNTAVGAFALQGNSPSSGNTGTFNTAIGHSALKSNAAGGNNVAIGAESLKLNSSGNQNVAIGQQALSNNAGGSYNVAIGGQALNSNTASYNIANGYQALANNSSGASNFAGGYMAMLTNTIGGKNVAIGDRALYYNNGKSESTAIGYLAMFYADNSAGAANTFNTALGAYALQGSSTAANNTGTRNTALGHSALQTVTSGTNNIAVGYSAGSAITTGSNNVVIGSDTGSSIATSSNNILLNDGAGNRRMTIDNNGNVGVGTTTPITKLDVSGGVRISMESAACAASYAGTLRYNGGNVEYCNGSVWSAFGVAGSGLTSLNGSTSATQNFAFGSFGVTPGVSTANGIHTLNFPLASTTGVVGGLLSYADYTSFSNKVSSQWSTSGTNVYYNSGSVGIGTAVPATYAKLHAYGSASNVAVRVENPAGFATYEASANGVNAILQSDLSNSRIYIGANSNHPVLVVVSGTERMRFDTTGNVGVGVANPAVKLDVNGTVRGYGTMTAYNTGSASEGGQFVLGFPSILPIGEASGTWNIDVYNPAGSNDFRIFRRDLSDVSQVFVTVKENGNVGIGTSSPTSALQLKAGTSSTASFKLTSGTLLTTPQAGAMEFDGFDYYVTDGAGVRRSIATGSNANTIDDASYINSSGNITMTPVGSVVVSSTTASTNSSTGALVVKGGLGVAGSIYASGAIMTSSNIEGSSITATSGLISPYIYGSISSAGNLTLDSTTHPNKGNILLAPSSGTKVGVGLTNPAFKFDIFDIITNATGGSITHNTYSQLMPTANQNSSAWNYGQYVYSEIPASNTKNIYSSHAGGYDNFNLSPNITIQNLYGLYGAAVNDATNVTISGELAGGWGEARSLKSSTLNKMYGWWAGSYVSAGTVTDASGLWAENTAIGGTITNLYGVKIMSSVSGSNVTNRYGLYIGAPTGSSAPTNDYAIYSAASQKSYIAGYLGIGTTNPGSQLSIHSASPVQMELRQTGGAKNDPAKFVIDETVDNSGEFWIVPTDDYDAGSTNDKFHIGDYDNRIARFTVNGAGQVGIGTSAPSQVLHLRANNAGVRLEEVAGSYAQVTTDSAGNLLLQADTASAAAASRMTFAVDGSEKMRLDQSGNLGIGTTSPLDALHIQRTGANDANIIAGATGTGSAGFYMDAANGDFVGADYGWLVQNDDLSVELGNAGNNPIYLTTNNSTVRMTILGGGNVGIGTSSPTTRLQVGDTSGSSAEEGVIVTSKDDAFLKLIADTDNVSEDQNPYIFMSQDGLSSTQYIIGITGSSGTDPRGNATSHTTSNAFYIGPATGTSGADIQFATDSSVRMTIEAGSGYVGIGTSQPTQLLHIEGASGTALKIVDGNQGAGKALISDANGVAGWQSIAATAWIASGTDIYMNTGNVGIGTTTPDERLKVRETSTSTATGSNYMADFKMTASPSSNPSSSQYNYGLNSQVDYGASVNAANAQLYGVKGYAQNSTSYLSGKLFGGTFASKVSGSGSSQYIYGSYNSAENAASTVVSGAYAVRGIAENSGAGTITEAVGGSFGVDQTAGTITTGIGVYISDIEGTTQYGVYQNGSNDRNYFAGAVGIGVTSAAAKLDVNGEVKFGNTSSTCSASTEGQQRYNSSTKLMEFCNGTAWQSVGVTTIQHERKVSATTTGAAITLTCSAGYKLTGCTCSYTDTATNYYAGYCRVLSDTQCWGQSGYGSPHNYEVTALCVK